MPEPALCSTDCNPRTSVSVQHSASNLQSTTLHLLQATSMRSTRTFFSWSWPFLLSVLLFPALTSGCPEFCSCFGGMVSCSDFRVLDLALLPPDTSTLTLSRADLEEIPPAFLARVRGLSMVEMLSLSARVVRGGAFRGIGSMDFLTINNCTFDIVEPEGLSGLHDIQRLHISESTFGRVGKHGFAEISSVIEFRLWNNKFGHISDEAFYQLNDVLSIQMFQNKIDYMGSNVFKGAMEVDDVNFFANYIRHAEETCINDLPSVAIRMAFYNNEFECSCNLVWMLRTKYWKEQNRCTFPGGEESRESTFRIADLPESVICVKTTTTQQTTTSLVDDDPDVVGFFYEKNNTSVLSENSTLGDNSNSSSTPAVLTRTEDQDGSEETEIYEFVDFIPEYTAVDDYEETDTVVPSDDTMPLSGTPQAITEEPINKSNLKIDNIFSVNEGDDRTEMAQNTSTFALNSTLVVDEPHEDIDTGRRKPFLPSNFTPSEPLSNDGPAVSADPEEDDQVKVAPAVSRDKAGPGDPAKPYATSAVGMDASSPENSAPALHSSLTSTILLLPLVLLKLLPY